MPDIRRVVFFGTPQFAVPTLNALAAAGRLPLLVVSQPSRPAGRGRRIQEPPVALWARQHGIELRQPDRVSDAEFLEELADLEPDIAVVVAFGQIFRPQLLELPRFGCMNLHASLLPKYRGAAPVPAAILAREQSTGVTTMVMDAGLDTGPMLLQRETRIGTQETAGQLAERLSALGANLVVESLAGLETGELAPRPQPADQASYARRLSKADGEVSWTQEASELFVRLRALTPWPGLTTTLSRRPVKLVWGRPLDGEAPQPAAPGAFLGMREECLEVVCGRGTLFGIERLQRPGRRVVNAAQFLHGEPLEPGEEFGR